MVRSELLCAIYIARDVRNYKKISIRSTQGAVSERSPRTSQREAGLSQRSPHLGRQAVGSR